MVDVDVIVFGATGDVGRVVCSFLYHNGRKAGVTSWAPAGRNKEKIKNVLGAVLNTSTTTPDGIVSSDVIHADATDERSLFDMASQAKVVIACAGPYAKMGEGVVKACVDAGTDYVDFTGELPWVEKMKRKYGAQAAEKGLRMVPLAGYDSVPADICTWALYDAFRSENEVLARVETLFRGNGGGLPEGTLNTILHGIGLMKQGLLNGLLSTVTFGVVGGSKTSKDKGKKDGSSQMNKPEKFVPKSASAAAASDFRNMIWPYSSLSGLFTPPHFMAVVNIPVVHATANELGYGDITYRERMGSPRGTVTNLWGLIPTAITNSVLMGFGAGALLPFFDPSLRWLMAKLNAGVKPKAHSKLLGGFKETGFTKVDAFGISQSGKTASCTLRSSYDPGLGFTAQTAVAVAGCLLKDARQGKGKGFGTAVAVIGGKELQAALGKVGVAVLAKTKSA